MLQLSFHWGHGIISSTKERKRRERGWWCRGPLRPPNLDDDEWLDSPLRALACLDKFWFFFSSAWLASRLSFSLIPCFIDQTSISVSGFETWTSMMYIYLTLAFCHTKIVESCLGYIFILSFRLIYYPLLIVTLHLWHLLVLLLETSKFLYFSFFLIILQMFVFVPHTLVVFSVTYFSEKHLVNNEWVLLISVSALLNCL